MKRFFALLLALVLVMTAVSGTVFARKEDNVLPDKHQQAIRNARNSYTGAKYAAGKTSFAGFCGLMTSYQLVSIGINDWLESGDGKDLYDLYCDKTVTTGGYYIKAYPSAGEMSLRDTLNMISQDGTRDVYNILLGFERTKTEAGSMFGHACLLNAIIDGTVYWVESFDSSIGKEGQVMQAPIEVVADYYENYAQFEGAIVFGTGAYADSCDVARTDLVLQTRYESVLRSQPAPVGQHGSEILRSVAAGERLRATELLTDALGQRYYKITDAELTGYMAAGACGVIDAGTDSVQLESVTATEELLWGTLYSTGGRITTLRATLADQSGAVVVDQTVGCDGYRVDLSALEITGLQAGNYTLRLEVSTVCAADGALIPRLYNGEICLPDRGLTVGAEQQEPAVRRETSAPEGWSLQEGKWYFYENGTAHTGWLDYCGVRYYLDETGAAVTGWHEADGVQLRFSATGALCTGWLKTEDGMTWRDGNGTAVTDQNIAINGTVYTADATGILTKIEETA